jgi:hypothetical protein
MQELSVEDKEEMLKLYQEVKGKFQRRWYKDYQLWGDGDIRFLNTSVGFIDTNVCIFGSMKNKRLR